LKIANNN